MLGLQTGERVHTHGHTHGVFLGYECGTQGALDLGLWGEREKAGYWLPSQDPQCAHSHGSSRYTASQKDGEGSFCSRRGGPWSLQGRSPRAAAMGGRRAALSPPHPAVVSGLEAPGRQDPGSATASRFLMACDKGLFLFAYLPNASTSMPSLSLLRTGQDELLSETVNLSLLPGTHSP